MKNWKQFKQGAIDRIASPYSADHNSLAYWRARILFAMLFWGLILGTFALVATLGLLIREKVWILALVDGSGLLTVGVLIFSRGMHYKVRASLALSLCYVIGMVITLSVGLLSGGPAWLFAFAVLVGVLLGAGPAMLAVLVNALSVTAVAWLTATGRIGQQLPFFSSPHAMLATGVNFVFLNALAAVSVSTLAEGLVAINRRERVSNDQLKKERSRLMQAKAELEEKILEHEKARGALKDSEEKYRRIFENSVVGFYQSTPSGRFLSVNPTFARILGYDSPDEVIAAIADIEVQTYVDAGDRTRFKKILQREGRIDNYEFKARRKDGTAVWVSSNARAYFDEQGRVAYFEGVILEITQRKRYEAEIHQIRAMLETAINQSPSGILIADAPDVRIRFANPAALQIRGLSPEQLTGIDVGEHMQRWQTYYPDGRSYEPENLPLSRAILQGETAKDVEVLIRHASGEERRVSANAAPIRDMDGNIEAGVAVFHDITERVKAQSDLRESEKRYRDLAEMLPEAVFETDQDLGITYANRCALDMFGYSREDIRGLNGLDFLVPEDRDRATANASVRMQGIDPGGFEYLAVRKDGSVFPVFFHADSIMQDGQFIGLRGIILDLTERKRRENEQARIESQYRQSQKVEAIGRLAGGIAHDLNNLLTPILGYGEMLLEDLGVDHRDLQPVEEIIRAANRARELVRKLLAFSRKQTLDYVPMNLNDTIKEFEKLLARTIREDIELKIDLAADIGTVKADMGQIEQVIMNLCINAQDAMPDGGRLSIETAMVALDDDYVSGHPGSRAGNFVRLTVYDTGCGMDSQTQEHIFEPFYSTKGEKGTGLGLATVYGIVKQHEGNIWVYSEPGLGTTFKVYLPVSGETAVHQQPANSTAVKIEGSEKILLVEDSDQVRLLTASMLQRLGYTVYAAANGHEALDILDSRDGELDILFTDVVMPDMNGKELFARISESYPDINVLFMSGYSEDVIAHRGVLDEGVRFIEKPFTLEVLSQKIRQSLLN